MEDRHGADCLSTHVHLVLASSGMRCISYVGAVTALADHGVEVDTVSGLHQSSGTKGGLVILWVAVGASACEESMRRDYQAANDPEHPLNSLTKADQERTLVEIGTKVKLALA